MRAGPEGVPFLGSGRGKKGPWDMVEEERVVLRLHKRQERPCLISSNCW